MRLSIKLSNLRRGDLTYDAVNRIGMAVSVINYRAGEIGVKWLKPTQAINDGARLERPGARNGGNDGGLARGGLSREAGITVGLRQRALVVAHQGERVGASSMTGGVSRIGSAPGQAA